MRTEASPPPAPEENLMQFIAVRIREMRAAFGGAGISQEALAKELDVATNTVSRWETGTYKPTIEDLEKIARFFRVSVLDFFPREKSEMSEEISALLRAAQQLNPQDIDELRRYAEFRKARYMLNRKTPGRKRK
jgi:transcriptional regulator with XRE-family HTH domain